MCRFLTVKSRTPINPQPLLNSFAKMAEKSRAYDGDWQGDGWGISWLDENNNWQIYKSLKPVWKKVQSIELPKSTKMFLIHARSASFPQHKNNIEYNQPFINNPYSYLFNGLLKGVSITLPGDIGAQKIWNLLQSQIMKYDPNTALEKTKTILQKNSKELQAVNIAFSDKKYIYALCHYTKHEKYYQLHLYKDDNIQFICSEPLSGYSSTPISSNQIIVI
jgi:predicted glutamine amidotransferase